MSILSKVPDGLQFFYGYREGDHRQINVREEGVREILHWKAYVGGEQIPGMYANKERAEAAAIAWAEANPAEE